MKSGICPKCGSSRIYMHLSIYATLYMGFWNRPVRLANFLCLDCRYVESYAPDDLDEQKIRRFWHPVPKAKRSDGNQT